MALIRSLHEGPNLDRVHPTQVDAEWSLVTTPSSNLLQISTFGSDDRQSVGAASQTIQFDAASARMLHSIIDRVFPPHSE